MRACAVDAVEQIAARMRARGPDVDLARPRRLALAARRRAPLQGAAAPPRALLVSTEILLGCGPMKIGVPREVTPGERRIALVPDSAKKLVAEGNEVWVESAGCVADRFRGRGIRGRRREARAERGGDLVVRRSSC